MKGGTKKEENTIVSLWNFKASLCSCTAQRVPLSKLLLSKVDALVKACDQAPPCTSWLTYNLWHTQPSAGHHGLWASTTPANQMELGTAMNPGTHKYTFQRPLLYPPQMCQDMVGGTARVGLLTGFVQIN